MRQDRFLTGILGGIAVLVLAALAVFFWRQDAPPSFPEDSPQGVVLRFVQALEDSRYRDAYALLAEGEETPSYEAFRRAVLLRRDARRQVAVEIGNAEIEGDEAWVQMWITWLSDTPFGGRGLRKEGQALLVRQEGSWRLVELPYPYEMWKP